VTPRQDAPGILTPPDQWSERSEHELAGDRAGTGRDRRAGVIAAGSPPEHGAPVFAPHVTMGRLAEGRNRSREGQRGCGRVVAGGLVPPFEGDDDRVRPFEPELFC